MKRNEKKKHKIKLKKNQKKESNQKEKRVREREKVRSKIVVEVMDPIISVSISREDPTSRDLSHIVLQPIGALRCLLPFSFSLSLLVPFIDLLISHSYNIISSTHK